MGDIYILQCNVVYWQTICGSKNYCTKIASTTELQKYECNDNDSLTSRATNAIKIAAERVKASKNSPADIYQPRINYGGYLRKTSWHYKQPDSKSSGTTESVKETIETSEIELTTNHRYLYWKKFSLFIGFSGTNYMGMQYNPNVPTIENSLFEAMVKNKWISEDNRDRPWTIGFQRGSRTDRGVSAARQCCSLMLRKFCLLNLRLSISTIKIIILFRLHSKDCGYRCPKPRSA